MRDEEFELWKRLSDVSNHLKSTTELLEVLVDGDVLPRGIRKYVEDQIRKNTKCESKCSPTDVVDIQMQELKITLDNWM